MATFAGSTSSVLPVAALASAAQRRHAGASARRGSASPPSRGGFEQDGWLPGSGACRVLVKTCVVTHFEREAYKGHVQAQAGSFSDSSLAFRICVSRIWTMVGGVKAFATGKCLHFGRHRPVLSRHGHCDG